MWATLLLMGFTLTTGSTATAVPEAQVLEQKLRAPVKEYDLSADNFIDALLRVARDFEFPMGIEWVEKPGALRPVEISERGTVRQVLDSLVGAQTGYGLEVSSGVVHVFCRGMRPDPQNFLNLNVGTFTARDELGGVASRNLRDVVKRWVSPPPPALPGAGEGGSYAGPTAERRVTFTLQNVAIREALDKLVPSSDFRIWVVTFSSATAVTPTGFRRTISLGRDRPAPDNEQPVWDLLTWQQIDTLGRTVPKGQ